MSQRFQRAIGVFLVAAVLSAVPSSVAAGSNDELLEALESSEYAGATGRQGSVLRLYTSIFRRLPDAGGFDFWVNQSDWDLRRVAAFFASSPEFVDTYGALDDEAFVRLMYVNVLGRDGEPGGVEFWVGIAGTVGRAEVVIGFSESLEYIEATSFASTTSPDSCEEIAAAFVTKGSANASLAVPEVAAVCSGDTVTVTANGIPDFTYIATSPGDPGAQNLEFSFPATPTVASDTTAIPYLGSMAVAVNGVPIYGPTEGTGGDVLSLPGALSECGSHNGPTGFHMHLMGTSASTDCMFTPEQVAAAPQLVGYAFDGFPIYSGNDQFTSSWELTNASLFATDTWSAHSYVAGSGDLDECNGLTDADGNYAYYTTDTFPYVMGCFRGEATLAVVADGPPRGR